MPYDDETEGGVEVSGLLISSDDGELDLFKGPEITLGKFNVGLWP